MQLVSEKGVELYRDLPWRNIDDPYAVLVSEVMLQQTQVSRVKRYWSRWMELFPAVDALAAADELVKLPGIGPATAAGVVAFAYDEPSVYIETNVRSVFLHELFPDREEVSDKQLVPYVADTCPSWGARAWYYALLDYGAHLKSQIANPARRSKHYARQSKFEGSRREKRSFLLKQVLAAPDGIDLEELAARLDEHEQQANRGAVDRGLFEAIVSELIGEGFFRREGELLIP